MKTKLLFFVVFSFVFAAFGQLTSFIEKIVVEPSSLIAGGRLSESSLPHFIATAFRNKLAQFPQFRSADCLSAKDVKFLGGFNTGQLFTLRSTCADPNGEDFIVKEAHHGFEESTKLNKIANYSPLSRISWPKSEPNKPTIALPIAYFAYSDGTKEHYLEVMPAAKGKILCDLIYDYKSSAQKPDIARTYRQMGLEVANFHNLVVPPSGDHKKLLKDSIIHGDLKCLNIFYDETKNHFTFIDNESMSNFLDHPGNRLTDIAKLLFGNYVMYDDPRATNVLQGLDLKQWYELSAKNFFQGYVEAFPKDQQKEALKELREIISGPFPGYYQQTLINEIRSKYINPIFDELAQKYP